MSKDLIISLLNGGNVRDLLLDEAYKVPASEIPKLDVDAIPPDDKDIQRAENLAFNNKRAFHGDGSPWASEASKMAKLITDPYKLVRRAKAVAMKWGTSDYNGENVWVPFLDRLKQMGFTSDQIFKIANYRE